MDKDTLLAIREMLKEELEPIKVSVDKLEKGQAKLEKSVDKLEKGQSKLEKSVDKLEKGQEKISKGQEELKTMIGELDPKNANRHIELQESIDQLRKDFSTVEIVTASNYLDLARLKV